MKKTRYFDENTKIMDKSKEESYINYQSINQFLPKFLINKTTFQNETLDGIIGFFDLCGFTFLAESLAAKERMTAFGNRVNSGKKASYGAEDLIVLINNIYKVIVPIINKSGGDIIKFAGDALLVWWPTMNPKVFEKCLKASMYIYELIPIINSKSPLKIKIGLDYGKINFNFLYYSDLKFRDFFLMGSPIKISGELADETEGKFILISTDFYDRIERKEIFESCTVALTNKYKVIPKQYSSINKKMKVQRIKEKAVTIPPRRLMLYFEYIPKEIQDIYKNSKNESLFTLNNFLCNFVLIEIGWMSEIRKLSILFILFPEIKDASFAILQKILDIFFPSLISFGGTYRQFMYDDKGIVLICIFGFNTTTAMISLINN